MFICLVPLVPHIGLQLVVWEQIIAVAEFFIIAQK